jgi:3-oxosteroid 1-dehydrogenase
VELEEADVVVVGSGGAALVAACTAAEAGAEVAVLEAAATFGGTTAVSGGMLWIGDNGMGEQIGIPDSRAETAEYLARVTRGEADPDLVAAFVESGPELVRWLTGETPVRLFPIARPDYNAHWPGGKPGGRVLDNAPFETARWAGLDDLVRRGAMFPPLTYDERHRWRWPERFDAELMAARKAAGVRTLGEALAAGLVAAALDRGVRLVAGVRGRELLTEDGRAAGVRGTTAAGEQVWRARRAVVLGCGGFEWNPEMTRSFLRGPATAAASPPWNVGDGLRMAMRAGAALAGMSEGWWAPVYQVPGERYEGRQLSRHLVDELALPGSILVNRAGRRFTNEAVNYNDLSKLFHVFEPGRYEYVNTPAWLVFDGRYKRSYAALTVRASQPAPAWFAAADSLAELAARVGIDPAGLAGTVREFNADARSGVDTRFGRGVRALDRYYGDPDHGPNPSLAPLAEPPYHAVPVLPGLLGTKGGARTDPDGRVLDHDGRAVPGLYACGNVAASAMGPGYPGAGGSLGPLLTHGFRCGRRIGADARRPRTPV